jgi:hypothetical protein
VDNELTLVTGLLKQAGCATVGGCHKIDDDLVEVDFRTAEDAREFLNVMAAYGPERRAQTATFPSAAAASPFRERLYERIKGCGSPGDWSYEVEPDGWGPDAAAEDGEALEDDSSLLFRLPVSVRFPRADLPLIRERLAEAVQDARRPAGPNGDIGSGASLWLDGDELVLLLGLCEAAIGACLARREGRPDTASVTFSSIGDARELLILMDEGSSGAAYPPGSGPGAAGINPRRVGACPDEGQFWFLEPRAVDHVMEEMVVKRVVVRPRSEPRFNFAVTMRIPIADLHSVYQHLHEVALERLRS